MGSASNVSRGYEDKRNCKGASVRKLIRNAKSIVSTSFAAHGKPMVIIVLYFRNHARYYNTWSHQNGCSVDESFS